MCGITGFFDPRGGSTEKLETTVRRMADTLRHRGPDDAGVWTEPEAGLALGHTRLSVIDLSTQGRQPMISHSGRYVIVFNGEVYNFESLKTELDREAGGMIRWRGHSDTEVLLEAIERRGLDRALDAFIGMFAFALWDRQERRLHLVRDRLGIKPLYYGWAGPVFLFGSELRALRRHPDFEGRLRREAVTLLLRHNCIGAPYSIFEEVRQLLPGHRLTLTPGPASQEVRPEPYWSAFDVAQKGLADPFRGTLEDAVEELERVLTEAVRLRLVSDVPLGAFLSGGIDSSTIAALMRRVSAGPVKTFSIGFTETGYDEAVFARRVADHLGCEHTEHYVTEQEALDTVTLLPTLYDEPFADSSQIPTVLVSQLARRQVTVALTGDGGDELFGGYAHYFWVRNVLRWNRRLPAPVRSLLARALKTVPVPLWDRLQGLFQPLLGRRFQLTRLGEKMHKLALILPETEVTSLYRQIISHWPRAETVVKGSQDPPFPPGLAAPETAFPDPERFMMFTDSVMYLPDDILTKVDRASMAVGLEVRVPLLDHRVYELAWRLPLDYRVGGGVTKRLLRRVLYRHLPRALVDRPKMGFSIPLAAWLRGPLKDWAGDLLEPARLREEGIFDWKAVQVKWEEHRTGKREWGALLWDVLMFQAWLRHPP